LEIENGRGEIDERLTRILNGASLVYEAEHYRRDGTRFFLEISSRAIDIGDVPHIQSFHRDITEKMKLQEQVLQSQKMESMGILAGGIAHDFNNILTAILGHAEVLRRHVNTDEFGKRRIKTIEDAARRAGQMVSKLLSFARKENMELAPTELNTVVMDTVELLGRALIDRNIDTQVMLHPHVPAISGDSIHLEQVIANLIMNSMDAMPDGGTITIATSYGEVGLDSSPVCPFLPPGGYVVLTVKDKGLGIPREIVDRIFDPFFTTKPAGKGTGLGLAMVYGIVKSHKGEIRVDSKEGEGTTFEVYLPVSIQPIPLQQALKESGREPYLSGARRETVLVVDDEKEVVFSIKDILEAEGYKVFAAENPEYGLELFHAVAGKIDVAIIDIVMPVMNGAELTKELKQINPSVKVIGMSGFDSGTIVKEARHIDCFLKKPFDGEALFACIGRVLHSDENDVSTGGVSA
jgi:signal transduction histidine kinase/ActR/RegA family two-component response regulator